MGSTIHIDGTRNLDTTKGGKVSILVYNEIIILYGAEAWFINRGQGRFKTKEMDFGGQLRGSNEYKE